MSPEARDLWTRAVGPTAVAAVLLVVAPGGGHSAVPMPASLAIGALAGTVLFRVLAGGFGVGAIRHSPRARIAAKATYLLIRLSAEEVIWRWFVLGSLAPRVGWPAALAVSTVGFAAMHVHGQGARGFRVHLLTGAVFGTVFLVTGSLAGAIAAHAAYNLLIAAGAKAEPDRRVRPRGRDIGVAAVGRHALVSELQEVEKRLGSTLALDGVDLELREGEILGVLGPNGAGKTTAVAIMLGLRRPDAGVARLLGRDPWTRSARLKIGLTPQDVSFPLTLKVREVVDLVAAHYPNPVDSRELLTRFELIELAEKQCGGLSGGQRRRLAVALAFAGTPEAVFLDEPTTGLDIEARQGLWHEIRSFAASGGTVLLTTHYLEEAELLADRVVVLNRGVVVEEGAVGEIRRRAGRTRIRLRGSPPTELLDGIEVVSHNGTFECVVEEPESFVRKLIDGGASINGLEVSSPGLEEAFLRLTKVEP